MGKNDEIKRRDVLKKTGVLAGASSVLSGNVSGKTSSRATERTQLVEQYLDQEKLEAAIRTHAGELVRELARRDMLASPSVGDLPLERFDANERLISADETDRKTTITSIPQDDGDERTALITVSEVTDTDSISLYVQPEAEKAYAIVYPEGDSAKRYKLDYSTDEITVQDDPCDDKVECDTGNWCENQCPGSASCGYYTEIHYDCYYDENPYGQGGCVCDAVDTTCHSDHGCICCYGGCAGCD